MQCKQIFPKFTMVLLCVSRGGAVCTYDYYEEVDSKYLLIYLSYWTCYHIEPMMIASN